MTEVSDGLVPSVDQWFSNFHMLPHHLRSVVRIQFPGIVYRVSVSANLG